MNISLQPSVLKWARARAYLSEADLAKKVGVKPKRVFEWEQRGELSVKQVENLAHHTHTPLGYLYLREPLEDRLSIPDFRTVGNAPLQRPSPDLLDTVHTMQRRQAWMKEYLVEEGADPLGFVGNATLNSQPEQVAVDMRAVLRVDDSWARQQESWSDALRSLRQDAEDAGILVMINGVVGNNTRRKLDVEEFQGFALGDSYAPLIFINNADFKGAQMFTFAHEMAHLWLGQEGVSNFDNLLPTEAAEERFCDQVAAEFLVPTDKLHQLWQEAERSGNAYQFLARQFKVSSLVIARRLLDIGLISRTEFIEFYRGYRDNIQQKGRKTRSGGDFWNNQNVRVGRRFGSAIVRATKEGRLLYQDAYSLTGMKGATFDEFARRINL